jgi:molybdate transport system substrate-binding protein
MRFAACALAACLAWSSALAGAPAAEVVVSAASSLTNVLQEVASRYQGRTGVHAVLNFGPSNTLARQIAAGAHVDLFISADEAQMDAVAADIVSGTRVDLLGNQLAVAVPEDRVRPLATVRDLLDPRFRRIAIGDPAAVPAGVYARQYLVGAGIWAALQPRIVPTGSVRLALAAVESGAADAAIVYRTDVGTARRARTALVVPPADGPRIAYPAAVLRTGAQPEQGRRFLAFLRSAEAARIFTAAGFIPLPQRAE